MTTEISAFSIGRFQEMIVAHLLQHGNDHRYNVPLLVEFNRDWSLSTVHGIVDKLLQHLPELGFRLAEYEKRYVLTSANKSVSVNFINTFGDDINLIYYIKVAHQYRFQLDEPLSRFTIISHEGKIFICCVFHHLIVDGLTIDNLKRLIVEISNGVECFEVASAYALTKHQENIDSILEVGLPSLSISPGLLHFSDLDFLPMLQRVAGQLRATVAEVLLCITGYALRGALSFEKIIVPHACRNTIKEFNSTGCLTSLIEVEISDCRNIVDDITHYRKSLEHYDPSMFADSGAIFSFRVIEKAVGEKSGITFLQENEFFRRYGLLAPNKIGISFLFEIVEEQEKKYSSYSIEYDGSKYSREIINEINCRIEYHLARLCGHVNEPALLPFVTSNKPMPANSGFAIAVRHFLSDGSVVFHSSKNVRARIDHYRTLFTTKGVHTVLISAPKSLDVLAAVYACYELGICYIPLDPIHSTDVRDDIARQCGVNALLTLSGESLSVEYVQAIKKMTDIQYVIYTSGSTGKPKGVKIRQDSIVELCRGIHYALRLDTPVRSLSYAELHFDMSVPDIYFPYFYGGEIAILDKQIRSSPDHLIRVINCLNPTLLQCTPTALGMLDQFQLSTLSVENLILGGEQVPKHFTPLQLPNVKRIWNFYGPTEAAVWCAYREISLTNDLDIDTSLPGYEVGIYRDGVPCQPYEIGEVYIGGPISPGYVDAAFDQNAFVRIVRDGIARTHYATGDMGEFIPKRGIKLLGRKDSQIKHNGMRIELEEIEAAFLSIKGVQDCMAAYDQAQKRLYAFVKPQLNIGTPNDLLKQVGRILPESKVPQQVILVSHIPVNANGKKERRISHLKALIEQSCTPKPECELESSQSSGDSIDIVSIIKNALNIDGETAFDKNFCEYGGSSIKAILVIQEIRRHGISVNINDLVESRTVSNFVDKVMEKLQ